MVTVRVTSLPLCRTMTSASASGSVSATARVRSRSSLISDDIAFLKTRFLGRAVIADGFDHRPFRRVQPQHLRDLGRHRADLNAKPAAGDFPVVGQVGHDVLHQIGWYGKADSDGAAIR